MHKRAARDASLQPCVSPVLSRGSERIVDIFEERRHDVGVGPKKLLERGDNGNVLDLSWWRRSTKL